MTERTAQNLMNVFDTFKDKSEKISHLGPSALYLLAAPSTPEAVLAEAAAYRPPQPIHQPLPPRHPRRRPDPVSGRLPVIQAPRN